VKDAGKLNRGHNLKNSKGRVTMELGIQEMGEKKAKTHHNHKLWERKGRTATENPWVGA